MARYRTCPICRTEASSGDRDEPPYPCLCDVSYEGLGETRERDEDDGRTYADPRDEQEQRLCLD